MGNNNSLKMAFFNLIAGNLIALWLNNLAISSIMTAMFILGLFDHFYIQSDTQDSQKKKGDI